MPHIHHLEAHLPWGNGGSPEIRQRDVAPRQSVAYECARGHKFSLNFALGAEVPDGWEHTCGAAAKRDGAPEGAETSVRLATPGTGKYEREGTDVTPMGQLRKRRSKKQGEAILNEALERARQTGAAR